MPALTITPEIKKDLEILKVCYWFHSVFPVFNRIMDVFASGSSFVVVYFCILQP